MGLVNLWTPPLRADGWKEYWFMNWQDHWEIANAIQTQKKLAQTLYIINPWTDDASEVLLEQHQRFHNDMNNAIGLSGQDFSVLDFKDPGAVKNWVWAHYQEHLKARINLGLA